MNFIISKLWKVLLHLTRDFPYLIPKAPYFIISGAAVNLQRFFTVFLEDIRSGIKIK